MIEVPRSLNEAISRYEMPTTRSRKRRNSVPKPYSVSRSTTGLK